MAFDGIVGRSLCITTTLSTPDFTLFCAPLGVTLVTITPEQLCIVKEEIETHKLFIFWILQNTSNVLGKTFQTFPFQFPARLPTATISLSVSPLEWGAHPLSLRPPIQVT